MSSWVWKLRYWLIITRGRTFQFKPHTNVALIRGNARQGGGKGCIDFVYAIYRRLLWPPTGRVNIFVYWLRVRYLLFSEQLLW